MKGLIKQAMRYQKPVILSNINVFKEIFEEAVIYINDSLSWKNAFEDLYDINKLIKLKDIEMKILNKYTWEKIKNI